MVILKFLWRHDISPPPLPPASGVIYGRTLTTFLHSVPVHPSLHVKFPSQKTGQLAGCLRQQCQSLSQDAKLGSAFAPPVGAVFSYQLWFSCAGMVYPRLEPGFDHSYLSSFGQLVYWRIPGASYFAQVILFGLFVFFSCAVWVPAARWSCYQRSCIFCQQCACGIVLSLFRNLERRGWMFAKAQPCRQVWAMSTLITLIRLESLLQIFTKHLSFRVLFGGSVADLNSVLLCVQVPHSRKVRPVL